MTDEQYERWRKELEKEAPKEWESNSQTSHSGNIYGSPKKEAKA